MLIKSANTDAHNTLLKDEHWRDFRADGVRYPLTVFPFKLSPKELILRDKKVGREALSGPSA